MRTFFEYSQGLNELAPPQGMPPMPPEEAHGEEAPLPPDIEAEVKGLGTIGLLARRLLTAIDKDVLNKGKSLRLLNLMVQHITGHVQGGKLSKTAVRGGAMNAMAPPQV
jgi:hypothetical protein